MTGLAGLTQCSLISHLLAVVLALDATQAPQVLVGLVAVAHGIARAALETHHRLHHHRVITAETVLTLPNLLAAGVVVLLRLVQMLQARLRAMAETVLHRLSQALLSHEQVEVEVVLAQVILHPALVAQVVVVLVGTTQMEQAEPQTLAVVVVVVAQEVVWPVRAAQAVQA